VEAFNRLRHGVAVGNIHGDDIGARSKKVIKEIKRSLDHEMDVEGR
jgi:hypothetical protein